MLNKGSTSWKQKIFGILLQKVYQRLLCYSMVGKYRTLGTFFMSIEARSELNCTDLVADNHFAPASDWDEILSEESFL